MQKGKPMANQDVERDKITTESTHTQMSQPSAVQAAKQGVPNQNPNPNRKKKNPKNNRPNIAPKKKTLEELKAQREAEKAERKAKKLIMAADDKYRLVSRNSPETNETISLINKNDILIRQLRDSIGTKNGAKIQIQEALETIEHQQKIRDAINIQNANICRMLGIPYRAPEGYEIKKDNRPQVDGRAPKTDANPPHVVVVETQQEPI